MEKNKIQKSKIMHFGIGNFHRSHQQFYTQQAMITTEDYNWGIVGVGIMPGDATLYGALKANDFSYTLMEKDDSTNSICTINTMTDYIFAPRNNTKVFEKAIEDDLAIISMTVTEGGYNIDKHTGEFDFENCQIKKDLKNPQEPTTIFGYLAECLRRRRIAGKNGVTLLTCDNVQHNGDVLKKTVLAFLDKQDKATADWARENCSFPNSMVDRITPKTSNEDIQILKDKYGIEDNALVACEPFIQWVIEDNFVAGRPQWEKAGAQFVSDVTPYEKMKLRILNSTHQALTYIGAVLGYQFVHEATKDKDFSKFLLNYMSEEVEPTLDPVPGIDLNDYKQKVIERFSNAQIKDTLARICEFTSDRIPTFNMPIIWDNLTFENPKYKASVLVLASWAVFLNGKTEDGQEYEIVDEQKELMLNLAENAKKSPKEFLNNRKLFGDIIDNNELTNYFEEYYNSLLNKGVKQTIIEFNQQN